MQEIQLKIVGNDDFFVQEAMKTLRTNVQFCGKNIRIIALTSCNENEGKSTVTLGLGKSLAELGKRVLVIDADMRKSSMAGRNANVRNPKGLSEILTGMCSVSDCIYKTQYPTLHILFSGKFPPNPVELLNGSFFKVLIQEAAKAYDYVLVDTPPLGQVIDASVIASECDGVILVVGSNAPGFRQAQEVLGQLRKSQVPVLGAVWNNHKKDGAKQRYYGEK